MIKILKINKIKQFKSIIYLFEHKKKRNSKHKEWKLNSKSKILDFNLKKLKKSKLKNNVKKRKKKLNKSQKER